MPIYYWTGTGIDTDWDSTGNWSSGVIPSFADDAIFGTSGQGDCILTGPVSAAFVDFTGYTGTFNTTGYTMTLSGGMTVDYSTMNSPNFDGTVNVYGGQLEFLGITTNRNFGGLVTVYGNVTVTNSGNGSSSLDMNNLWTSSPTGSSTISFIDADNSMRFTDKDQPPTHGDTIIQNSIVGFYHTSNTNGEIDDFGLGTITLDNGTFATNQDASFIYTTRNDFILKGSCILNWARSGAGNPNVVMSGTWTFRDDGTNLTIPDWRGGNNNYLDFTNQIRFEGDNQSISTGSFSNGKYVRISGDLYSEGDFTINSSTGNVRNFSLMNTSTTSITGDLIFSGNLGIDGFTDSASIRFTGSSPQMTVDWDNGDSDFGGTLIFESSASQIYSSSGDISNFTGDTSGSQVTFGGSGEFRFTNPDSNLDHEDTTITSGIVGLYYSTLTAVVSGSLGTGDVTLDGGTLSVRSDGADIQFLNKIVVTSNGGILEDGRVSSPDRGQDFYGGIDLGGTLEMQSSGGFGGSSLFGSNSEGYVIKLMSSAPECRFIMASDRSFRQISLDGPIVEEPGNTNPLILENNAQREFFLNGDSPNWSSGLIVTNSNPNSRPANQEGIVCFNEEADSLGKGDVTFNGGAYRISQEQTVYGNLLFTGANNIWAGTQRNKLNCLGTITLSGSLDFEVDYRFTDFITQSQDDRELLFYYETTATDDSNEGNNGTVNGTLSSNGMGLLPYDTTSSMYFNGIDTWISVPTTNELGASSSTAKTMHLLFRPVTVSGNQLLYEEGGGSTGMNIRLENDNLIAMIHDISGSGDYVELLYNGIEAGETYQVLWRYQGTDGSNTEFIDLWVNGIKVDEETTLSNIPPSFPSHTNGNGIGYVNNTTIVDNLGTTWTGNYYHGYISHIATWSTALSDSVVENLTKSFQFHIGTNSVSLSGASIDIYDGSTLATHGDTITVTLPETNIHGGNITFGDDLSDWFIFPKITVQSPTVINLGSDVQLFNPNGGPLLVNNSGDKIQIEGNSTGTTFKISSGNNTIDFDMNDILMSEGSLEFSANPTFNKERYTGTFNITGAEDSLPSRVVFRNNVDDTTFNLTGVLRTGFGDGFFEANLDDGNSRVSSGVRSSLSVNANDFTFSCNDRLSFNFSADDNASYLVNFNLTNSQFLSTYNLDGIIVDSPSITANLSMTNSKMLATAMGYDSFSDGMYVWDYIDQDDESYFIFTDFPNDVNGSSSQMNFRSQNPTNNSGLPSSEPQVMYGYASEDKPYDTRPISQIGTSMSPVLITAGYDEIHGFQDPIGGNGEGVYKFFQVEGRKGWMLESYDLTSPYTDDTHFIIHENNFEWKNVIGRNEDSYDYGATSYMSQFLFPNDRTYYVRVTEYGTYQNEDPTALPTSQYGLRMVQQENFKRKEIDSFVGTSTTRGNGIYKKLIINDATLDLVDTLGDDPLVVTEKAVFEENAYVESQAGEVITVTGRLELRTEGFNVSSPGTVSLSINTSGNNVVGQHLDFEGLNVINENLNVIKCNNKGNNTKVNFRRPW